MMKHFPRVFCIPSVPPSTTSSSSSSSSFTSSSSSLITWSLLKLRLAKLLPPQRASFPQSTSLVEMCDATSTLNCIKTNNLIQVVNKPLISLQDAINFAKLGYGLVLCGLTNTHVLAGSAGDDRQQTQEKERCKSECERMLIYM